MPREQVEQRLPIITERLPAFAQQAGGAQAPMLAAVHAMRVFEEHLPISRTGFVGLFGGIEWQWLTARALIDRDYEVSGRVLAVTDSPRSETPWTETTLHDPANGRCIARMLMLSRLLKESSRPAGKGHPRTMKTTSAYPPALRALMILWLSCAIGFIHGRSCGRSGARGAWSPGRRCHAIDLARGHGAFCRGGSASRTRDCRLALVPEQRCTGCDA